MMGMIIFPLIVMFVASVFNQHLYDFATFWGLLLATVSIIIASAIAIAGSGINPTGTRIAFFTGLLAIIWGELTATNFSFFSEIPDWLYIYSFLSVIYALGIIFSIRGGEY